MFEELQRVVSAVADADYVYLGVWTDEFAVVDDVLHGELNVLRCVRAAADVVVYLVYSRWWVCGRRAWQCVPGDVCHEHGVFMRVQELTWVEHDDARCLVITAVAGDRFIGGGAAEELLDEAYDAA